MNPYMPLNGKVTLHLERYAVAQHNGTDFIIIVKGYLNEGRAPKGCENKEEKTITLEAWELENVVKTCTSILSLPRDIWNYAEWSEDKSARLAVLAAILSDASEDLDNVAK